MPSMDDYDILSVIGSGATAVVKLAREKHSNDLVVLKQFHIPLSQLPQESRQRIEKEISILSSLSHPAVITYLDSFICDDYRIIVMEYANARSLRHYINHLIETSTSIPESVLVRWIETITDALLYIHSHCIIHRDLKPENILLLTGESASLSNKQVEDCYHPSSISKLQLKVSDFGIARETESMLAMTQVGTPYYLAPEICQSRIYTNKVDMWSLGCNMYELMTKRTPFQSNSLNGLFQNIIHSEMPPLQVNYSSYLCRIVQLLLSAGGKRALLSTEESGTAAFCRRASSSSSEWEGLAIRRERSSGNFSLFFGKEIHHSLADG
ncbi:hypothetical protein WA588_006349 [Blastocystis sp. NMH]